MTNHMETSLMIFPTVVIRTLNTNSTIHICRTETLISLVFVVLPDNICHIKTIIVREPGKRGGGYPPSVNAWSKSTLRE